MADKKPVEAQKPETWLLHRRPPFDELEENVQYFWDGELPVIRGDIYIPADIDHLGWARRCLKKGYDWPNGIVPDTFTALDEAN